MYSKPPFRVNRTFPVDLGHLTTDKGRDLILVIDPKWDLLLHLKLTGSQHGTNSDSERTPVPPQKAGLHEKEAGDEGNKLTLTFAQFARLVCKYSESILLGT